MMFYPDSVELFSAYPWLCSRPHDIEIYDATGRLLTNVFAFNPETGEVIRYQASSGPGAILTTHVIFDNPLWRHTRRESAYCFLGIPWLKVSCDHLAIDVWRRHGFWPAPLRVVPSGGMVDLLG